MPTTIAAPKTKTQKPKAAPTAEEDFLPLHGTDYVEFYVGNAKQAAHFYKAAFGFQSLAYSGPETGVKDRASYAIRQNKLTLLLTTPIRANNPIADHVYKHGDGVYSGRCRFGLGRDHETRGQELYGAEDAVG